MADAFRANVSVTPIVTLTDADADNTDVIHHDVKQRLGSKLNVSADDASGTGRWYYSAATIIGYTAGDIVGGLKADTSYLDGSTTTYTDGTAYGLLDDILGIYIEHLGIDENNNASTVPVYFSIDGSAGYSTTHEALQLDAGESIVLKFAQLDIQYLHGFTRYNTSETVKIKILALVNDLL
jgi:hypothetical protein